MAVVDWSALASAVTFYQGRGFELIDVPWRVRPEIARITHPSFDESENLALVGSAEQSFLELESRGGLAGRDLVAVSPCFRTEPVYDELHRPEFMKVELYRSGDVDESHVERFVDLARTHFTKLLCSSGHYSGDIPSIERLETAEGVDLCLNGIEIGSYGLRNFGATRWVYGTGLAEPRFSVAKLQTSD